MPNSLPENDGDLAFCSENALDAASPAWLYTSMTILIKNGTDLGYSKKKAAWPADVLSDNHETTYAHHKLPYLGQKERRIRQPTRLFDSCSA